jgi:hypothetical protein
VADDGSVPGLPPDRADLAVHLRQLLAATVDPVPYFNARRLKYRSVEIGVGRVYASDDTPHITAGGRIVVTSVQSGGDFTTEARRVGAEAFVLKADLARAPLTTWLAAE